MSTLATTTGSEVRLRLRTIGGTTGEEAANMIRAIAPALKAGAERVLKEALG